MNIDEITKEAAEKMMDPKLKDISKEAYDLQLTAFTGIIKEACLKSCGYSEDELKKWFKEKWKSEIQKTNEDEIIEDGFGSAWSKRCPECGRLSMQVVRPGSAQCSHCG